MSVGTAFHPRTAPLNRKMQWREWSGYYASSAYADFHDIEYNAIREAAAVIDVSPLYKYRITGPDALRLADRVITRDATKLKVGQVYYTPWCDEHGKVIDDGTVHRVAEDELRWTAADPQFRWLTMNAAGLDVGDRGRQRVGRRRSRSRARSVARCSRRRPGEAFGDLRYFRRRATQDRPASTIDVSRTGYTGDLGYELWIPAERAEAVWDALFKAGARVRASGRPGMLALDVTRLEAGLILLEVDYTSARHAMNPEQNYSPFEIGLGRLVELRQGGLRRPARPQGRAGGRRPASGGSSASMLDWYDIERLYDEQGLPPAISPTIDRSPRAGVRATAGARSARRRSTAGARSSSRRSRSPRSPPRFERVGTRVQVEWTVEGRRGRVDATVVELPFLDLERKRA